MNNNQMYNIGQCNRIIYHHLGMGDHIVCNGFVREYVKKYGKIGLFCKPHNIPSVQFMFRDLGDRVLIIPADDAFALDFYRRNPHICVGCGYMIYGFEELIQKYDGVNIGFDKIFYDQVGVPHNLRWDSFYVLRDFESEHKLMQDLGIIDGEEYIFVHDDESRGYTINKDLLPNNIKIVRPIIGLTDNMFNYIGIYLKAKEIHCIDSSFKCLIDNYGGVDGIRLVYHDYARHGYPPSVKYNWETLI